MSTIKADTIKNKKSLAINLPNKLKIGGFPVEQGYTASATEPSNPAIGDFWWDTADEKLYRYVNNEFYEINIAAPVVATNSYGDRGFLAGGNGANANIDYHDITTLGNMSDFGNLTRNFQRGAGASSGTRALFMGGSNSTTSGNRIHYTANYTDTIDYITCATTGNATDFGDASSVSIDSSATSDGVTAVHYLSVTATGLSSQSNVLDKVTIATTGNATDFGDLGSVGWVNADVGVSNNTRGLFAGGAGYSSPWAPTNPIHYITIATPGNSTDFGDLTAARYGGPGVGGGTSDRGIWAGGYISSGYALSIDYVTISTTGNAADFGDLTGRQTTTDTYHIGASYNATRGCFYYAAYNDIQYITLATTGNSSDFGDQLASAGNTAYARSSSGYAS